MIIKLASGKEIVLNEIVKDPRAEAIRWLREYKARRQAVPGSQRRCIVGLRDDIATLEARFQSEKATQDDGHNLAVAIAEMIGRKGSKRLVWAWFGDLAEILDGLGRYGELVEAADGVDPLKLGVWDCQKAVGVWLAVQQSPRESIDATAN